MIAKLLSASLVVVWLLSPAAVLDGRAAAPSQGKPQLRESSAKSGDRTEQFLKMIAGAVRHELVTLPYYDVFDWLDGEVYPDGKVVLRGEVVRPTTRSDAEARVRKIESVAEVVNEIKVLPVSSIDDGYRLALYRAIYNWNSTLFRYATRTMPPIRIIVENGRATLKGVVASKIDSQLAYTAAKQVPGLFDVRNELRVEN